MLSTALILATLTAASDCTGLPDTDADGLSDPCELQLARLFAPSLVASAAACNWEEGLGRLSGAYLFGVAPTETGIRIAYLPAYTMDCGWSGPKCWLRWRGGCAPHAGDSEFIVVDIQLRAGRWEAVRVFLSAHCFGGSDGDCRWVDAAELQRFDSRFLVWVAEGKNANYGSRAACDRGHHRYDTCDRNDVHFRYPIESDTQNIGSALRPFPSHEQPGPCVSATDLPHLSAGGRECIWSEDRFRGWSGQPVRGATGYGRYLSEVAGWMGAPSEGPGSDPGVIR